MDWTKNVEEDGICYMITFWRQSKLEPSSLSEILTKTAEETVQPDSLAASGGGGVGLFSESMDH